MLASDAPPLEVGFRGETASGLGAGPPFPRRPAGRVPVSRPPPAHPLAVPVTAPGRRWWPAATVSLAVLTMASAAGFAGVFYRGSWAAPVLATAVIGHVTAALGRRLRWPAAATLVVSLAAVTLVGMYLVVPGPLWYGLPLAREWSHVGRIAGAAVAGTQTLAPPVAPVPGFVLLAAWTVGAAAAVGDLLAFSLMSPLAALAPAVTVFTTAAILGTGGDRTGRVVLELAAAAAFVAVHQATAGRAGSTRCGRRRPWSLTVGAAMGVVALIAALITMPLAAGREGTGTLGWRAVSGRSGGRVIPSPLDDLRTRLLQETHTPVMTVRTNVPSYWRLTSLDTFNGFYWQATHSYQAFHTNLPGVPRAASGSRLVVAHFHIQKLDSVWLPSAYDPVKVIGGSKITWDPVSGSLISSRPTANGENYAVVAEEQLAELQPSRLAASPAVPAGVARRYTQLPWLPPAIIHLARSITAHAKTEYAKAYALEQYFHGPDWTYSTDPPSADSVDALSDFLFNLHSGYCQQYAGAYAVLARSIGVPTRIAVGFQEGRKIGTHLYQVTDADAHAWPEVYFADVGWVPFEPTPGSQLPGTSAYTGHTGSAAPVTPSAPAPAASQKPAAGATPARISKAERLTAPSLRAATVTAPTGAPVGQWIGLTFAALVVGVGLWIGAGATGRRLRWNRRRRRSSGGAPALGVLVAWEEVAETLAWWRLERAPEETITEFAGRAARRLRQLLGRTAPTASMVEELAALAERSRYAPAGTAATGEQAVRARALADQVTARLATSASSGRRLRRIADPRYSLRSL
jgi:transglutaminase-like putative cysteine protease